MSRPRRWSAGAAIAVVPAALALATAAIPAAAAADPFFPHEGSSAYDVTHYDLDLRYSPDRRRLRGVARLDLVATRDLHSMRIDLRRRLGVDRVAIDGIRADFTQNARHLAITAPPAVGAGDSAKVTIRYAGRPGPITDADGSQEGWFPTHDGAVVAAEPIGAPTWFPANDRPTDKASFTIAITVPRGLVGVANGVLAARRHDHRTSTFRWRQAGPMAPYLATAAIGRFRLSHTRFDGLRSWTAVDPGINGAARSLRALPAITRWFAGLFGAYPFAATGAIVDDAPRVGYALETQSRPLFPSVPSEVTLAHEIAHQWFGNAVTLARWRDIWLHEGFATWAEWSWREHAGGSTVAQTYRNLFATPAANSDFWNPPAADPGNPKNLFDASIYNRGGMALQALRERVGEADFLEILRRFYDDNRYGNVTTADFTTLAEDVSGDDLGAFFDAWLYQPGKPPPQFGP